MEVVNSTGSQINFSYELIDKKLGFQMESPDFNDANYVFRKIVHVPYNRNYTIQFYSFQTPPIEFTLNTLSAQNVSPECSDINNVNCEFIANVTIDNTVAPVAIHGWINTTEWGTQGNINSNLTNLSVVIYLVFGGESVMSAATLPANIGQFFGLANDNVSASTTTGAFYNVNWCFLQRHAGGDDHWI